MFRDFWNSLSREEQEKIYATECGKIDEILRFRNANNKNFIRDAVDIFHSSIEELMADEKIKYIEFSDVPTMLNTLRLYYKRHIERLIGRSRSGKNFGSKPSRCTDILAVDSFPNNVLPNPMAYSVGNEVESELELKTEHKALREYVKNSSLGEITKKYVESLELASTMGWTTREIADHIGTTENNIRQIIHRLKQVNHFSLDLIEDRAL